MRRNTLPVFDDPPGHQRADDVERLGVILTVSAAAFAYALVAVNLLGPPACSTQALTPECASALIGGFYGR